MAAHKHKPTACSSSTAFLFQDISIDRKYCILEHLNKDVPEMFLLFYYTNHPEKESWTTWNRLSQNNNSAPFLSTHSTFCLKQSTVNKTFPYNCTLKWLFFAFCFCFLIPKAPLFCPAYSRAQCCCFSLQTAFDTDRTPYQQPSKHGNSFSILTGYLNGTWCKVFIRNHQREVLQQCSR